MISLLRATIAFLAASVLAGPGARAQEGDDDFVLHGFSIYDTQAAKSLAQSAREHVAAERWSEALVDLQRLIEEHRGELLGATRPAIAGRRSEQDVHPGASHRAAEVLAGLPEEVRELYRERHADRAREALEAAVARGDRGGLTTVARRWPITHEAERAWWALGDLEIEHGNLDDGIRAWGRGLALVLGRPGLEPTRRDDWSAALRELTPVDDGSPARDGSRGLRSRVEFALEHLDDGPDADAGGTALDPGRDFGTPPGRDADTWNAPVQVPLHPFTQGYSRPFNLYPARFEDTVFVSTTIDVVAVNAYTGEVQWQRGEELCGWDDVSPVERSQYFEGVDHESALIAPAASQGVVVAALQIPWSSEEKIDYGDMRIIVRIPNRRLFAFDARSGELLWKTTPPPGWDGESGSFADRMQVVGAPVIVGSRVLVPCARLRGRIEYHVGCYDLWSGELLWSTALITGQRELNMFGRKETEFSAPPVRVSGNRVIALTQLGTLAALDLFTGDTLWEVLYEQIPVQPGHHFRPGNFEPKWENAPPVVAGGVVVATPHDSRQLVAVDVESGALLWSMDHDLVNRMARSANARLDLLVGADESHVYLTGTKVVAFECPLGIGRHPKDRDWIYPMGSERLSSAPRPVLGERRMYVPDGKTLATIDLASGMRVEEPFAGGPGNLLLADGMMFALQPRKLLGFFEWEKLVERSRERLAQGGPGEPDLALDLAVLLEKRGTAEWQRGNTRAALPHLAEARALLEDLVRRDAAPEAPAELHWALRSHAKVLKDDARTTEALTALERARTLAPDRGALRDTLIEEQALLRTHARTADWLDTLGVLLERCGDLPLLCEPDLGRPDSESGTLRPALGPIESRAEGLVEVPVGLWVLVQRAVHYRGEGRSAEEFADLHAILAEWSDVPIGDVPAGEWAAARIANKLEHGDVDGYAPFERRAGELYEQALAAHDEPLLERIPRLYPSSAAAAAANDTRLSWAVAAGDVATVAEVVLGELDADWRLERASERELRHLLRLAHVMGATGNLELRAGLAAAIARSHPDLRSDLPGSEGVALAELALAWRMPPAPDAATAEASYDPTRLRVALQLPGRFVPLGAIRPAPGDTGKVLLYADGEHLVALSDVGGVHAAWPEYLNLEETPTDWALRYATTAGRAHLATKSRVVTHDRAGEELWSWSGEARGVRSLIASDGVVVAVEDLKPQRTADRDHVVVGLDAASGTELWRLEVDGRRAWLDPIVAGDGRFVLFPRHGTTAAIHDLFTGRPVATFQVEALRDSDLRAAWIERGVLVVPRFQAATQASRNHLSGIDLATGAESWRVDFETGRLSGFELVSIVVSAGRTYLELHPSQTSTAVRRRAGLYELTDVARGAIGLAPVVELQPEDVLIAIEPRQRMELDDPFVFVRAAPRAGDELSVRAIHLPYGPRWQAVLPLVEDDYYRRTMALPAVSASSVAIGWRERDAGKKPQYRLLFVDRVDGRLLDKRTLDPQLDGGKRIPVTAIGDGLVLCGENTLEVWR